MDPLTMTAIGTGMGIILGKHNDNRQYEQQERLQNLQIQGQKEMGHFNMARQLEMWKATNYAPTVEEMKKAGLNPGMLYGMKGGGGATTGNPSGNVQGSQAATGGGQEIQQMSAMGLQMGLMEAQKRVMETQADKNAAEAAKTAGTDTQESQTRIDSLLQGIDNARQQHEIQKLEITLKNIENFEKQATQDDRIDYIEYQTKIAMKQLRMISNDTTISDATIQDKIQIIQREAIGAALRNTLTIAQTDKTRMDIRVSDQQINNFIQQNMREWDKMSQTNKEIAIKQLIGDFHTDPVQHRSLMDIIDNIFIMTPKIQPGRTVIEGFKQKY